MAAGSIVIDLLMKTGSFESSSKRASRSMSDFRKEAVKTGKTLAVFSAAAAAAAATSAAAWVNSVSKTMDATKKMADQIGTTTESLSGLRYAASEMANVSEGTFDMSLRRMTRRISEAADGSGAAKNAIEMLGLSARDLTLLPVEEQFLQVADAIKGADNQGKRLRATMAIFDTEGMPLVNALSQGREEISKYTKEAERMGLVVSTKAAKAAQDFQTQMSELRSSMSGFSIKVANEVLPIINSFIGELKESNGKTKDLYGSVKELSSDTSLQTWIHGIAKSLAVLADIAVKTAQAINVVIQSSLMVGTDIGYAIGSIKNQGSRLFGRSGGEVDVEQRAMRELRQSQLDSSNKAISDLVKPLFIFSDAMDKAIAEASNKSNNPVLATLRNFKSWGLKPQTPDKPDEEDEEDKGNKSGGRMSDAGADYIRSLHERIALLGKETEYEQLLARISIGSMQFRTEGQQNLALESAKQYDELKKQIELEETLRDLREQQTITQMQFMRELEAYGQGNNMRELIGDLATVEDRYRSIIDARRNSPLGLSDDELELIRESLETELEMVRQHHEAKRELEANWQLGALEGLRNYADEVANVYKSVSDVVGSAFKGMEDALVDFVTTGKADFKSLANSIISDLMRIAIQQQITGVFANALGGVFGGGASNASWGPALAPVPQLYTGGYTGHGGKYEPAGIVHKGEYVFSKEATQRIGVGRLERMHRGYASGGYVGNAPSLPSVTNNQGDVQVNVINKSSQPVRSRASASTDAAGRMVVDIMLEDLHANGPYAQSLKRVMA